MLRKLIFFTIFYICFVTLFNFISTINIEELESLTYEVIFQTPIKKGGEQPLPVLHMTSKYGQEYQCVLPHIEHDDVSEKETISEKHTNINKLLEPMKSESCLLKNKDWWTYEFCFGKYIKQFHMQGSQIIGQVITLGLYDSDYNWNNETDQEKFKHVKQRYHSQFYVNGTNCELTGQPRKTEVRLYCEEDARDYIYHVDEPSTCSYIITIYTSRLCSHPLLKPFPSRKAHGIPCHPLLNEDQYAKYLKKYNEEKELADQERSQWLNDQQARLQEMKKENLHQMESEELSQLKKKSNNDKEIPSEVPPTDKKNSEWEIETEGAPKTFEDKHASVLDDVEPPRLDKKSTDSDGKLYEMNSMQRKKLEQAVKEKLEKAGLDTEGF